MHLFYPPKSCINIVFDFSWDDCCIQGKLETIDLIIVLDSILWDKQPREKLQCLYENLMSNYFRKMAILKKKYKL